MLSSKIKWYVYPVVLNTPSVAYRRLVQNAEVFLILYEGLQDLKPKAPMAKEFGVGPGNCLNVNRKIASVWARGEPLYLR